MAYESRSHWFGRVALVVRVSLIAILALSVIAPTAALAADNPASGSVRPSGVAVPSAEGVVSDAVTGEPIPGAVITMYLIDYMTGDQSLYGTVTTDADGYYITPGIGTSMFHLIVSAPGYWDFDVMEVTFSSSSTKRLDFELEPLPLVNPIDVEGTDRFATAAKASSLAFPDGSDTVVIASGRNFPDALGGSALAGALNAPVLLVEQSYIPQVVEDEIDRLGATKAIIIGGQFAVGVGVWEDLSQMYIPVTRIEGVDRYETAKKVAEETVRVQGAAYDGRVFFATGTNFPDALAAAPLAASGGTPILLVKPTEIPAFTTQALASVSPTEAIVLGGTGAVSATVYGQLQTEFGAANVTRLGESDRYSTAVRIAQYGVDEFGLSWDGLAFATGTNFPDALAGGATQGFIGSVVMLTKSTSLPDAPRLKLLDVGSEIFDVYYLGGTGAISDATRALIEDTIISTK